MSHSYIVVGQPGNKRHSGVAYYSISGDEKRGGMTIDQLFMDELGEDQSGKFSDDMRAIIGRLQGNNYASKEAFYQDYSRLRRLSNPDIPITQIQDEALKLFHIVPKTYMEMWLRVPNGYDSDKPNLAERDCRRFENMDGREIDTGKLLSDFSEKEILSGNALRFTDIAIKAIDIDPLALLEAKQAHLLHRRYVDEIHGRNGTGLPDSFPEKTDGVAQQAIAKGTPRYAFMPPFATDLSGNCNSGVATLLQEALGTRTTLSEAGITPARPTAFGFEHRIRTWRPVRDMPEGARVPPPSPDIDRRSIRHEPTDVRELSRWLRRKIEMSKPIPGVKVKSE